MDIAAEQLNEISLEDVEIEQDSRHRIYQTLCDMTLLPSLEASLADEKAELQSVPCTGFWVENTRELVLFAWNRDRTKTIVIPPENWFLREDITLH